MDTLKQKTISGLIWSFVGTFAGQGIQFLIGIILARLLTPQEFGLIGMIVFFIAISESFVNSGFTNALIRKKNCTQADYSTVFFYNLIVGILLYGVLYISASNIASFFNEPTLESILQVLGVVVLIDALAMIQRTILIKNINFRLQARILIIASSASGIISIGMAYNGCGVWSLVVQRLSYQTFISVLLCVWNGWRPGFIFDKTSFKELFGFGSKLFLSGLIHTIYQNIYYLVIGKFFSAQDLGFYTRANEFNKIPSQNLNGIIGRVSYPVLSSIQDDQIKLKAAYRRIIRSTMFITFALMLGMAAVAEPMIISLVGEKWRQSIVYLQMLCFEGMFIPLHALNLNMLMVQGRSDLFLKLEIIKKTLAIPVVIIGIVYGIKVMIAGMVLQSIISYWLNSYWSGKMIGYSFLNQVKDIMPAFFLALSMALIVFLSGEQLPFEPFIKLIVQAFAGAIYIILISELFNFNDYFYLKAILFQKLNTLMRKNGVC